MNRLLASLRQASTVQRVRWGLLTLGVFPLILVLLFSGKPWQEMPADRSLGVADYVRIWFWVAAAVNALILSLLAWTAAWWVHAPRTSPGPMFSNKSAAWFWPLVILSVVMLAFFAAPRLDQSLWHDEANRVKNTLVGSYVERDGEMQFRPAKWRDTFFYYRMPNHTLQSILSRASHDLWSMVARPTGWPVSETALRAPLFLAGLLGVVSLAVFLRALGQPGAGVLAAWLLALHPWYIRYASEARGYGIVMALLPVLLLAMLRCVESGRARWWVLYGIVQVALVYSYATAAYILVVGNLAFVILICFSKIPALDRPGILTRWLVTNIASGAVFLQLFLPCVPQFLEYLQSEKGLGAGNQLDLLWVQNFFGHLLAGIPWTHTRSLDEPYIELLPWACNHPGLLAGGALLAVGLVALGLRWCLATGGFSSLAAAVFLLPAIFSFSETKARGAFLFEWYLIFLLPGVVALLALGAADLSRSTDGKGGRMVVTFLLLVAGVAWAAWTGPIRTDLASTSLQPYREAVLATRPTLNPLDPRQDRIITAFFHAGPLLYDPRILRVQTPEELQELMARADREERELFINFAYPDTTQFTQAENFKLVTESGLFEEKAFFRGFHPSLSTRVFRYRPEAAANLDPAQEETSSPPEQPGKPSIELAP